MIFFFFYVKGSLKNGQYAVVTLSTEKIKSIAQKVSRNHGRLLFNFVFAVGNLVVIVTTKPTLYCLYSSEKLVWRPVLLECQALSV